MLFDTPECDERDYIAAVERHCGFPSNSFRYDGENSNCDLEASVDHPEVRYAPITLALGSVLSRARDNGVRVLLSGTGGDEFLASGFHHLTDLATAGRWWTLARQLRSDAELYSTSASRLFGDYCIKPFIPQPVLGSLRRFKRHLAADEEHDWLVPEARERAAAHRASRLDDVAVEFPTRTQRFLRDVLLYNSNLIYAVGENDLLGSRYSIEYRYPFLDRRVVEFLIAIPEEQRWWMDRPKTILRRALRSVLPEEIRERRTKAEFSVLLDHEIRGGLASQVETLIRESRLASLGVVNSAALLRRFRAFVDGREQAGSRWAIFNFIGLELWSRSLAERNSGGSA
jgi:asparagine synthase (glutamine-hydrolysing)